MLIIKPSSSSSAATMAQGQPFFSINNIEVTEGTNPQAVFTVSLTYQGGAREFTSSVSYAVVNGTAAAGSDYQQSTGTVNFPLAAPLQSDFRGGTFDAFFAKVNESGSEFEHSTYFGGSGLDSGFAVATGTASSAYVIGLTDSVDFPIVNAFQINNSGGAADLFITKFSSGPVITAAIIKGADLNITGSGFARGAVLVLNGKNQKIKYQSATSLKGKKAGRKIAQGQTVRLQVRNPDGALSQELSFTR